MSLRAPTAPYLASAPSPTVLKGSAESLSFKISWAYLFLIFSRITEFFGLVTGLNLRLVLPTAGASVAANILNGGIMRSLLSPCGVLLSAFSLWMVICVPFSVWRGGSVLLIRDRWLIAYLTFLILACMSSLQQCRKLFHALVMSELVMLWAIQLLGVQKQGRLSMQAGTLGNANDLAIHILLGFPFIYLLLLPGRSRSRGLQVFLIISCLLLALSVFGTGSRTGLLVLCAIFLIVFWRMPVSGKAGVLLVGAIVVPLGLSIATDTAVDRFRTLLSNDSELDSQSMAEASASSATRMDLLLESLRLTIQHPIFGIGPGMFPVATGWRWETGIGMGWRQTHNTYTELSSETGIPGFALYVAVLVWCLRRTITICRATRGQPHLAEIYDMAFCLLLALITFTISAPFSSMTYHTHLPMLAGLTTSLDFTSRPALARDWRQAPRPVFISKVLGRA